MLFYKKNGIPGVACGLGNLIFPDNSNLITGIVLEFAVPTAVVSLMWVTIYSGNNAMSLALVVIDTVLAPFLIPATLHVMVGSRVQIDVTQMMLQLIFMVALPAVLAMTLNQCSKGKAQKVLPSKVAPFS